MIFVVISKHQICPNCVAKIEFILQCVTGQSEDEIQHFGANLDLIFDPGSSTLGPVQSIFAMDNLLLL